MAEGGPPQGPIKLVILPRTRVGLGRDGLRRHLEAIHGPMVVGEVDVSGRFVSYVHHYAQDMPAVPGAKVLADRDAVTIIRFASLADMVASKASDAYRDRVGPDEDNFRELDGSIALFADETVVAPGIEQAERKLFVFRSHAANVPDAWAKALAAEAGLTGVVTNQARVVEGGFRYVQFDEIGLSAAADPALVIARLAGLARAHFDDCETGLVLAEPVRFI